MKIDSTQSVEGRIDSGRSAKTTGAGDAGRQSVAGTAGANPANPNPAVSIDINVAALESLKGLDRASDNELLEELRARVQSGEFQIDVDKAAEAILINAIAQSRAKISSK